MPARTEADLRSVAAEAKQIDENTRISWTVADVADNKTERRQPGESIAGGRSGGIAGRQPEITPADIGKEQQSLVDQSLI